MIFSTNLSAQGLNSKEWNHQLAEANTSLVVKNRTGSPEKTFQYKSHYQSKMKKSVKFIF